MPHEIPFENLVLKSQKITGGSEISSENELSDLLISKIIAQI
jgi:hypothetical protein